MRPNRRTVLGAFAASVLAGTPLTGLAQTSPPAVVATIAPLHALVSEVMAGTGSTPHLLLRGTSSPHGYTLRPSDAAALQDADVVFWIGEELEAFLAGPLDQLAADAVRDPLFGAPGLVRLPVRAGGAFEMHDHAHDHGPEHGDPAEDGAGHGDHGHGDHGHDDHGHDDHGHDDHGHDDHGHDDHGHDDHGHGHGDHDHGDHGHDDHGHGDHGHAGLDPHIWLDPANAVVMAERIATVLSNRDPANAALYRQNMAALVSKYIGLTEEIRAMLEPVTDQPIIVFHDAYQYFERRFGLTVAGSITVNPELPPSAARVAEIRDRIATLGAVCVMAEPQFTAQVIDTVTEGSGASVGVLDPIGADLVPGPSLYEALLRRNAQAILDCAAG